MFETIFWQLLWPAILPVIGQFIALAISFFKLDEGFDDIQNKRFSLPALFAVIYILILFKFNFLALVVMITPVVMRLFNLNEGSIQSIQSWVRYIIPGLLIFGIIISIIAGIGIVAGIAFFGSHIPTGLPTNLPGISQPATAAKPDPCPTGMRIGEDRYYFRCVKDKGLVFVGQSYKACPTDIETDKTKKYAGFACTMQTVTKNGNQVKASVLTPPNWSPPSK